MAFRSREMMKKIVKKIGGEKNLTPRNKEQLMKSLPNNKVVMGRAQRGLFAGRHIQFGNNVSEDGGNKTKRNWKPNVQEKRLFSYILDRHIRIKVTTHALRCIDKAGGIDEYLLKTPYHKMDTETGLYWKSKIKKMYEDLGDMEVVFFSPEDETNFEEQFKQLKLDEREARKEARRKILCKDTGYHVNREAVTYIIASHQMEKGKVVMNCDLPKPVATKELAQPAQDAQTELARPAQDAQTELARPAQDAQTELAQPAQDDQTA